MTGTTSAIDSLYKVRKGKVDIVEVPEFGYLSVDGEGDPEDPRFAAAVQALYSVAYGVHFLVKKELGLAPKVMPLEGLWWAEGPEPDLITAIALGRTDLAETPRDLWRWRAMIMQPAPIGEEAVMRAVEQARAKPLPALDRLRYVRWEEGRCAQVLHVGPYAEEGPTIVRLHEEIVSAGYRPYGRHHEIYLGDPRRSAPERLRTLIRHPVQPA